jgi:hypothetical protein
MTRGRRVSNSSRERFLQGAAGMAAATKAPCLTIQNWPDGTPRSVTPGVMDQKCL